MAGQESPRSSRSARTVLVGAALAVAVVVGVLLTVLSSRAPSGDGVGLANAPGELATSPTLQDRPAPGEQFPLPPVTLAAFGDGPEVDLASYRGEPLVVNFWATWCAPCVKEMPDFERVATEAGDKVAFLGVDVMDSAINAEPFVKKLGISYDLAVDLQGEYWKRLNSFGMPTTLFVRPDGTVVYRHTGPLDAAQLRNLLSEHLEVTI